MATVENYNLAVAGNLGMYAPEKVTRQLLFRWFFKRLHMNALWIDIGKNTFNCPILSTRIHCLDDNEEAVLVLRIKVVLLDFQILPELTHERTVLILGPVKE